MIATFTYRGKVRGQGRPKLGRGHAYERAEDTRYKAAIRCAFMEQCPCFFGDAPLRVTVDVMRALPKSKLRKFALPSSRHRLLDKLLGEPDTYKPDGDNLAKAVMDALNCVAYVDDSQVVELVIKKFPRVKMPDDLDALRVTISTVTDMLYPYVYRD